MPSIRPWCRLRRRAGISTRRSCSIRTRTAPGALLHVLAQEMEHLRKDFEAKLARDAFKEGQIDKLHTEVQSYKTGLLLKIQRPYIMGLVQLHDGLGRLMEHMGNSPEKQYTMEEAVSLLRGFQEDVELLMEQNAIRPFHEQGEVFVPARQTSLQTVPASAPDEVGHIARRVRPGFEQEEIVVQKERVCVYGPPAGPPRH